MQPPPEEEAPPPDPQRAAVVVGCASACELVAASLVCGQGYCSGTVGYAVAVGIVSLLLLLPMCLVLFAEPLAPRQLPAGLPHLALLLLCWWVPACFVLTFISPFTYLSNGYFASVASLAGAFQLCRAYVPAVDLAAQGFVAGARGAPTERLVLCGLALSSTAMWVQAAISIGQVNEHIAVKAWAIIVGIVSFIICIFYLLLEQAPTHRVSFAALLSGWWCQGIAISFVPTHYIGTLNGFIATWASVFLTAYFLRTNELTRDLMPVPSAEPDDDGLGGPTTTYHAAADATDGFSSAFDRPGGGIGHAGGQSKWIAEAVALPPRPLASAPTTDGFRHTDAGLEPP